MEKEGKLFSHTLLLGAASVISKAITFFMLPLYTAALSPAEFGVADILVSTAVLLLPIVSLHAPEAVFRFRTSGERGALSVGALFLLVGLGIFAICLPLLGFSRVLRPYLFLLYFYVAASILRSFLAHVLRSDGAFGLYAVQQVFCTLLTVLLQILFLRVKHLGVAGFLLAVILSDVTTFALLFAFQLPRLRAGGKPGKPLCRRMVRYALPMIPSTVLWWVMSVSDRYLVLLYDGEAATGVYAAAGRLPALLTLAIGIFLESWHYAAVRAKKEEQGALFGRIYALLLPVLVAMSVFVMLFAIPLVRLFLASSYRDAAIFTPLLVFASLCGGLANFLGSIYALRLRSGAALSTGLVAALCNVVLNLLLIPRYHAFGAALSTAVTYALLLCLRLWQTKRLLDFPRLLPRLIPSLALLLCAGILFARRGFLAGAIPALLSLAPVFTLGQRALVFVWRRGLIFLSDLKKRGKYSKKI